ncbi:hypothetical protein PENANT_c014G08541 [Penicillium antarcticum]|uniref:Uncharacterized protein n=1 Tax=Penicillium antarcticum TaxID=416450 RepID=A0A1V6Q431_9EURO|nr:hypothetical protein PENANT_c014G08541 [Penicillium antarcticum]
MADIALAERNRQCDKFLGAKRGM